MNSQFSWVPNRFMKRRRKAQIGAYGTYRFFTKFCGIFKNSSGSDSLIHLFIYFVWKRVENRQGIGLEWRATNSWLISSQQLAKPPAFARLNKSAISKKSMKICFSSLRVKRRHIAPYTRSQPQKCGCFVFRCSQLSSVERPRLISRVAVVLRNGESFIRQMNTEILKIE